MEDQLIHRQIRLAFTAGSLIATAWADRPRWLSRPVQPAARSDAVRHRSTAEERPDVVSPDLTSAAEPKP
jgi:hypothetical protein